MEKYFILPIITLAILAIATAILLLSPETRNFLTSLVISPQEYALKGQIKITTPVWLYDNCSLNIAIENEETKQTQERTISAREFKEKAQLIQEESYFTYIAELKDLTQGIVLEKSAYFITIKVFCDNNLISQTQEYFAID